MGVIKPPWISNYWFDQCPFNYCDHFGDQEFLAEICKICRDTRNERFSEEEEARQVLDLRVKPTPFSLDKGLIPEDDSDLLEGEDAFTNAVNTLLYLLRGYGNTVQKICNVFWYIPHQEKTELILSPGCIVSFSSLCICQN